MLDRVVYMRSEDGFSSYEYVLWDVQNETTLASINVLGDIEQIPYWSKETNQFVLAFSPFDPQGVNRYWPIFELHTIDKNGEVVQRTQLSAIYDWVSVFDYSWSPDGNEIAFWFSAGNDEEISTYDSREEYLGVINVESGAITNYCVPGDFSGQLGKGSIFIPYPLWSPDGKQLVVVNRYDEDNHNRVILVDLETEQAYQIAENAIPVGWLLANP